MSTYDVLACKSSIIYNRKLSPYAIRKPTWHRDIPMVKQVRQNICVCSLPSD